MATRPANQASGSGTTNKPRPANQQSGGAGTTNRPKAKVKAPAKKAPADTHAGYTPAPVDPLMANANQQAAGIYAPQVQANASLQASVPTWYAKYMASAAAQAAGQQAATAPILAQQNAAVTNLNAPAAGLDPSSAEYAKSQQAGRGLSALAQFSADNTQANLGAGQQYFAGQQANAARYLPEALTALKTQGGVIASQQAGKAQELYQGAKTQAVNADIAYKTLNVNSADKLADNTLQAQTAAQTAADKKAARVVSRKNTRDRLTATTNTRQAAADKQAAKDAAKVAADAAKKTAAIQKAVGKAKVKVQDVQDAWARGGTMPAPTTANPNATRPANRDELRRLLGGKYGTQWVGIMERVRKGQALTPQQIDYLHSQDPDFRVPKEWKSGKTSAKPTSRPKHASGDASGKGQYRPT
jgi:hypothetical protein